MNSHMDVLLPFHVDNQYFREAVQSVLSSVNIRLNVILIDDRTDRSNAIPRFNLFGHDLQIVRTLGGVGYGKALEVGSKYLLSETVALMNSDDLIAPEKFSRQLLSLQSAELSITGIKRTSSEGRNSISLAGNQNFSSYDPHLLIFGAYGANATWAMRKSWWLANSFFDSAPALDWRIAMRSFNHTSISYIPEALYSYRRHQTQHTVANKSTEIYSDLYQEWQLFLSSYFDVNTSFEVFSLIATPWKRLTHVDIRELDQWLVNLEGSTVDLPDEIQRTIRYLVERRLLIASINPALPNKTRLKLLFESRFAIFALSREYIRALC